MIPDLGKCPNQKRHEIRKYAYLRVFMVSALPEVRNQFQKPFFDKVVYNYCSKFFWWSVSSQKMTFRKMDFPLYFQKVIWLGGTFLSAILFLKKPSPSEYAQVLVVMWTKHNHVTALLSPRPTIGGFEFCFFLLHISYSSVEAILSSFDIFIFLPWLP